MQRLILRTITVMSVMCFCCFTPCDTFANDSDAGPEKDPIALEEVSLTCPPPATVDCDDNGIYMTYAEFEAAGGSVNLPNGCVVDSFTFVADIEISQNGCDFVYFREYFITSSCGNTFTCNQIIMLTDDDDPIISNCPSDTTFQVSMAPCTIDFDVPDIETTDGCSSVTVSNDAPMAFPVGVTLVTYTAMDDCGNSSMCSFSVTVENNNSISVDCPPAINDDSVCDISGIPPYADFAAFEAAGGSASGECTTVSTIFTIDSISNEQIGGSCPITVNRTYFISDDEGNQGSCVQVITITDDTDPTFTVPSDATGIECTMVQDTSVTGSPTDILDNCDPDPVLSFVDSDTIPGSCMGEYTFTRTWFVTDECDNQAEDTQSISVVDNTPPTAICQDTVTIYLDVLGDADVEPSDLDNGSFDLCSDVSFDADMSSVSCNQVGILTSIMLEVTDDCDNLATCEVLVMVLDTMPVVLNSPENDTTDCIDNVDLPFTTFNDYEFFGGGSVDDNCPAGNTLSLISADTTGTCPTIITRVYEYEDNSMNTDTAAHTIVIIDEEPPVIVSCVADISISETDICDTLIVFGMPIVTDNCDEVTITNDYTNDTSTMAVFSGGVTEIVFTVTDLCGNSITCSSTITIDAEPQFTCPPLGVIDGEDDLPDYPTLLDFLNAGGAVNDFCAFDDTTFVYTSTFEIDSTGCEAIITESIAINDTLGNPFTTEKMSTATDTLNPVISGCFTQFVQLIHETCELDTTFVLPSVTDNFGVDTSYFSVGEFLEDTADVVFYAEDLCGNIDSCNFELIIFDPTSPDIELDDITIMCDVTVEAPIYTTIDEFLTGPGALIYDCRLDSMSFIHVGDVMNMDGTITRTYSVDDLAGNTSTTTQIIAIMDSTPPEITTCSSDITINAEVDTCGAVVDVEDPIFMDNCGGMLILTNDYNGTDDADDFYPVGTTTVVWTIEDENGLTDTCSFTVEVIDNTNPTIVCPSDTMIVCTIDAYPAFTTIAAFIGGGGEVSDNCDLVGITEVTTDIGSNMYTREYTVTDANGLESSCTQDIEVIDTIAPELTCISMILETTEINTCDKFITIIPPTATDDCDNDITITNSLTGAADPSGLFSDTTFITWYAEDDFGNIDSCTYPIIIVDATGPVISNADTTMIMCEDMLADVDTFMTVQDIIDAGGSATDNCGIEFINFISQIDIGNDSIKRTYEIVDTAGNTSSLTHCIVISDITPPEITTCSSDITINAEVDTCGAVVDVEDPIFMDNCGGMLILTNDYNGTDDADDFYPVGTTTVVWTIEDENGLTDTCSFTVEVIDNTNPTIVCPSDTMIVCTIDAYPAFTTIAAFIGGGGEVSDNCDLVGITEVTTDIGSNMYTREYTVTDANGLESSCTQDIEVIDTIAPELTCISMILETTEINTCDKFITIIPPTATDDCDNDITITNSLTGAADPSGLFSDTTFITWYAEDDFGNIDSCTYPIIIVDATGPVISNADTTMIMCEDMLADVDTFMTVQDIIDAGGSATDNCGIEFINFISQIDIGNDSIKRTYEIVDSSGNTSSLTHCIVIDDTTDPTFDAPADVTIECDDDVNDLGLTGTVDSTMLADNCMDIDTLIYVDTTDPGICPFINEITRVWILTDNSGNEARDTQIISTIDTIAPVFDNMPASIAAIDCDDDFPMQETLSATDACSGATIQTDTLPFVVEVCSGYDVTFRWIAVDGCDNRDTLTQTFSVNPDTTPPELLDINDMTVESEGDICGIRVDSVPGPIFDEDCATFDLVRDYSDTIYYVGVNLVEWIATNECGIDSIVTQEVVVVDNILPTVLCKDATAGLTADPQNYVYASSFVDTATDNCGIDSIFVRRLTAACDDPDNNVFGDSIHICCEDVGTIVNVEIRVVDESGNENFCDATLEVDDERPPVVEEPLPNITISCSYPIDTLDLEVFGSFTADPSGREDIIIEDIFYESQDSIAGLDGLISDECDVEIQDTTIVDLDQCNNGTITRVFTFTDIGGNVTTSEQTITIEDVSPFNENGTDIIWPDDFTFNHCLNPAPDTSVSGAPEFLNDDKCALVSATFKDQLFNYPTNVCPKIRRKWQVIDWCQYDESQTPNPGLWTYNQFIFVENEIAPTITSACTDTIICTPNNACSGFVSLGIEAIDDCAEDTPYLTYEYSINVNNDSDNSNDISGQASSFNVELDLGVHQVVWVVTDRCGNKTSCSYLLTLNECKAPTAVCLFGLAINLDQNGEAELWATDVNQNSFDNCTDAENLIFSFSSDINDFGKTFDCEDAGTSQSIEMWVTDEEGNQSFCSTFVDVQDNNGYCGNIIDENDPTSFYGKIATETNQAVPEAMVHIFGAEMDGDYMTEDDGTYAFEGINVENDYQITVDRDKDDKEGVSTLDLVMIQRHILGLQEFESPYKLIAADVNNTETITASDLVALRKLILGIDDSFADNESWRFVSKQGDMDDMNNPWPFDEDLILGNVPLLEIDADFVGVKIGDVNNSIDEFIAPELIENRNFNSYGIVTRDRTIHRDDEALVDFISGSDMNLEALQMTIEWDQRSMNLIDIIPVGIQLEEAFLNTSRIEDGLLTIAWSSVEHTAIAQGIPIFQLKFEGNESFKLSEHLEITSSITDAVAYDENDDSYDIELRFEEGQVDGLMMMQNKPNPFAFETEIEFSIPESMEVTFKVFNGAGSLIHRTTQYYNSGKNSIKLSEEFGAHTGLLFIKMETAEFSDVKRMIRIE